MPAKGQPRKQAFLTIVVPGLPRYLFSAQSKGVFSTTH